VCSERLALLKDEKNSFHTVTVKNIMLWLGLSKIVFRLLFCVASRHLKPSNECESSHFKSKK